LKRITILILALLILSAACSNNADEIHDSSLIVGAEKTPTITTTYATTETTKVEITDSTKVATSVQTVATETPREDKVYFFSEIDEDLGPGPFSVNSLSEKYELIQAFGVGYNHNYNAIIAEYDGVSFHLVNNFSKELSFEEGFIIQGTVSLSDEDKDVFIKPYLTIITSDKINLPRNIKIGDSIEDVATAYDGNEGSNFFQYDDFYRVVYWYRPEVIEALTDNERFNLEAQTGSVSYCFEDEVLVRVEIRWFEGYLAFD